MFADDTSLFSKVKDSSLSLSDLSHDNNKSMGSSMENIT